MLNDITAVVKDCVAMARRFKAMLDDEREILKNNDLVKIAKMTTAKESLLKEFSALKDEVCDALGIPRRRFDQVEINEYINKIESDKASLSPLITELWELQHQCHNQFIINNNVITARMHFLRKTIDDLLQSDQEEVAYTQTGAIEHSKSSIGRTTA